MSCRVADHAGNQIRCDSGVKLQQLAVLYRQRDSVPCSDTPRYVGFCIGFARTPGLEDALLQLLRSVLRPLQDLRKCSVSILLKVVGSGGQW